MCRRTFIRSGVTSAVPEEQNLRTIRQSRVLVWTTVLRLAYKRKPGQQTKRKYQPSDCLADPRRQPPFSCRQCGYVYRWQKNSKPDGESDIRLRFDQGILDLTGYGDKGGETPILKSGYGGGDGNTLGSLNPS
ncbi:hypothetical protein Tco_1051764 [Tanacetum coccineum]